MKSILASAALLCAAASMMSAQGLVSKQGASGADTLILSRSVYTGNASTVSVGQTLPPGCVAGTVKVPTLSGGTAKVAVTCATATNNGTYPAVFNNDVVDGSFGVTSPIFLDNISKNGKLLGTYSVPSNLIVTSFSSKSELSLHLSLDGKSITFVGYQGGPGFVTAPNQLDVSNSNTPGVVDPTNPVVSQYYRAVAEVDADGNLQITPGNAYSGNNGRAAIKASDSAYYLTGNDNNGGLSKSQLTTTQVGLNLITSTGAEFLVPGQTPPVPPNIDMIGDFEITQLGYPTPDKAGKDNNFRGLTIFNNTLYVTKGSGGNGINTVYQVGDAGALPTGSQADLAAAPITVLPGFPTTLASGVALDGSTGNPVAFPFGIWFADANTLYVCDEGDGTLVSPPVNGNVASAASQATAGIQKWLFDGTSWSMAYILQNGLDIGIPYTISGYPSPATDGCRNLTGKTNGDGTVDLYAVTSTVSTSGDQGADPNKLVTVKDQLKATTLPKGLGQFTTLRAAGFGEVLRGVTFAPHN
ncbi:MAG TPA: hypothetical protein VKB38_22230 [Terracidiphilus sp.]|nr:hypothetical protein [Terracidiphilus sp.]